MVKKKTNKTTLDKLAGMVARDFESVDKRFEQVDKRFEYIEHKMVTKEDFELRMTRVDSKIEEIYDILARFEEGDILDLQKRIKILERTVRAMSKHIG